MLSSIAHLEERFGHSFIELYELIRNDFPGNSYIQGHAARFAVTILYLRSIITPATRVLELGFSGLLHNYLHMQVACWDYTVFPDDFSESLEPKVTYVNLTLPAPLKSVLARKIVINFEDYLFPLPDKSYDLIICAEVIEHMDVDPMSLMSEINRLSNDKGNLFLTTPNAVSARIVYKALIGEHPSFFMKYSSSRSPYRHNLEYNPKMIKALLSSAGFECAKFETLDTFENPLEIGLDYIKKLDCSQSDRGDNIFIHAVKYDQVRNRFPPEIYS